MGDLLDHNSIHSSCKSGICLAVLSRAGAASPTGGAAEAARLLSDYGWSDSTWRNRTSQVLKWLVFCDEDERCPLPATEGDVLAYFGFLSLENRISSISLPRYLTSVSRYHILHHLPSPTNTQMVRAMVVAYSRRRDARRAATLTLVGCSVYFMRKVVELSIGCTPVADVGHCATFVFTFLFQCIFTSFRSVWPDNISLSPDLVSLVFTKRKFKAFNRPLQLRYPSSPSWPL